MKYLIAILTTFVLSLNVTASEKSFIDNNFSHKPQVGFGKNDRKDSASQKYPGSTFGKLIGPSGACTAGLISDYYIATAAHCFYKFNKKNKTYKLKRGTYSFNHSYHNGKYKDSAIVDQIWTGFDDGDHSVVNDWAVAKLTKPMGKYYGFLGYDFNLLPMLENQSSLNIVGYGRYFKNGETQTKHLKCRLEKNFPQQRAFYHSCDTSSGDSGSPIYVKHNDNYYIVGIHKGGGSSENPKDFYKNYSHDVSNIALYSDQLLNHIKSARKNNLKNGIQLNPKNLKDFNFYTFNIKNNCNEDIHVAINLKWMSNGSWAPIGWWKVNAKSETNILADNNNTDIKTTNRFFYYYASSKNYVWDGNNKSDSVLKTIGDYQYNMRLSEIDGKRWGNHTLSLRCN